MLITSVMIFGTLGIYRKFMPLSSASIACYRGIIGVIFLIIFLKISRYNIKSIFRLDIKNFLLLFLTGIFLGVNWLFLFEGYNYASVSLVTLCCYMQPMFVIVMSAIFFKEKITLKKFLCFVSALTGMIFISGIIETGMPGRGDITGMLCGLCSGFLYALVVIFNKFIKGVDPYAKTIIQLAASSCAMLPYMFFKQSYAGNVWNLNSLILMLIIGVVNTGLAYALYFGSIENKNLKAQTIALFGYLDPVTALILAALILGESLSIYGIIGVILILGAALVCELE